MRSERFIRLTTFLAIAGIWLGLHPAGASAHDPQTQLTVFMTSESPRGNLGGLAGADGICQRLADTAGLEGTYRAWLSDSTTSAGERFAGTDQALPYVGTDGVVVADNWADLTDGVLHAPVIYDENGVIRMGGAFHVWTNTNPDGTIDESGMHCNDWTSSDVADMGQIGRYTNIDAGWTDHSLIHCNGKRPDPSTRIDTTPLYCFEYHPDSDGDGIHNDFDACPDDSTNLCDPSYATLIVSDDMVGTNCDGFGNGGHRVRSGLDDGAPGGTEDDGVLDDMEVDETLFICNGGDGTSGTDGTDGADGTDGTSGTDGTDGTDGMNGLVPLILLTNVPAGESCESGGQRIDVGFDDDASGSLDAGEIDDTSYVCNGEASGGCSVSASESRQRFPLVLLALVAAALVARRRR